MNSLNNIDQIIEEAEGSQNLTDKQITSLSNYCSHEPEAAQRVEKIRHILWRFCENKRPLSIQKDYHEECEVSGIQINIGWDTENDSYTINFPQVNFHDALEREEGVESVNITKLRDVAKQVYDFAVRQASEAKDVYELSQRVADYSGWLPEDMNDIEDEVIE